MHGIYRWVFDSLDVLSDFIKQVVVNRRDTGIRKWTWWLREDLGARPYVWLRPDFVPPSPFLVVKDPLTEASRILVEPHLIDAEFRKVWMPLFCRSGHPVHLLPRITGRDLQDVALQVVLVVGLGMRSKRCLHLGFLVWLFF